MLHNMLLSVIKNGRYLSLLSTIALLQSCFMLDAAREPLRSTGISDFLLQRELEEQKTRRELEKVEPDSYGSFVVNPYPEEEDEESDLEDFQAYNALLKRIEYARDKQRALERDVAWPRLEQWEKDLILNRVLRKPIPTSRYKQRKALENVFPYQQHVDE